MKQAIGRLQNQPPLNKFYASRLDKEMENRLYLGEDYIRLSNTFETAGFR
jgi:hypothetical protein